MPKLVREDLLREQRLALEHRLLAVPREADEETRAGLPRLPAPRARRPRRFAPAGRTGGPRPSATSSSCVCCVSSTTHKRVSRSNESEHQRRCENERHCKERGHDADRPERGPHDAQDQHTSGTPVPPTRPAEADVHGKGHVAQQPEQQQHVGGSRKHRHEQRARVGLASPARARPARSRRVPAGDRSPSRTAHRAAACAPVSAVQPYRAPPRQQSRATRSQRADRSRATKRSGGTAPGISSRRPADRLRRPRGARAGRRPADRRRVADARERAPGCARRIRRCARRPWTFRLRGWSGRRGRLGLRFVSHLRRPRVQGT